MKSPKEIYLEAQKQIENDKASFYVTSKKEATQNQYVFAHLKENLDWYKLKYDDRPNHTKHTGILEEVGGAYFQKQINESFADF